MHVDAQSPVGGLLYDRKPPTTTLQARWCPVMCRVIDTLDLLIGLGLSAMHPVERTCWHYAMS